MKTLEPSPLHKQSLQYYDNSRRTGTVSSTSVPYQVVRGRIAVHIPTNNNAMKVDVKIQSPADVTKIKRGTVPPQTALFLLPHLPVTDFCHNTNTAILYQIDTKSWDVERALVRSTLTKPFSFCWGGGGISGTETGRLAASRAAK